MIVKPGARIRLKGGRVVHIIRDDCWATWCGYMPQAADDDTPAPDLPVCRTCARHTEETA